MNIFSDSIYKIEGDRYYIDNNSISKDTKARTKSFFHSNADLTAVYKKIESVTVDSLKKELVNKTPQDITQAAAFLKTFQKKIEKRERHYISSLIVSIYNFVASLFGFKKIEVVHYDSKKLNLLIKSIDAAQGLSNAPTLTGQTRVNTSTHSSGQSSTSSSLSSGQPGVNTSTHSSRQPSASSSLSSGEPRVNTSTHGSRQPSASSSLSSGEPRVNTSTHSSGQPSTSSSLSSGESRVNTSTSSSLTSASALSKRQAQAAAEAALCSGLKAAVDEYNDTPTMTQPHLSMLFFKVICDAVKLSDSADELVAKVPEIMQGFNVKTRFESSPEKITAHLQQVAIDEALNEGNCALAIKVIKPDQLDGLLRLNLENLPNIINLLKGIPKGGLNAMRPFTLQIGKDFLTECQYYNLAGGQPEKRQKLNQALLSLKEVLPEEVEAIEKQLGELINKLTDHQISVLRNTSKEEWHTRMLESITLLFTFLDNQEAEVKDFIQCLTGISEKVDSQMHQQKDLLLNAYVGLGRALLLQAGDHIRGKLDQLQVDFREDTLTVDQLQELLAHVPPLFDTQIDFEIAMEVENDDLLTNLISKFPDLEVDAITDFVHIELNGRGLDVDFFNKWLLERFPTFRVTTLNKLLTEYTLNQSFQQHFPREQPAVISGWIYTNIIEKGADLGAFQTWWENNKAGINSLSQLILI